jgi:hypothetical protein
MKGATNHSADQLAKWTSKVSNEALDGVHQGGPGWGVRKHTSQDCKVQEGDAECNSTRAVFAGGRHHNAMPCKMVDGCCRKQSSSAGKTLLSASVKM